MTEHKVNIKNTSIEYELFESLRKDNLGYVYRGVFTPKITDYILNLAETGFIQNSDTKTVKRKIYHVIVEGLQNIIKHQANPEDLVGTDKGILVLKRESDRYLFTTCNLIENSGIETVSEQIEHVNNLDKDNLKEYYKKILINGAISEKGGAGLGLIDMSLKSGSKLSCYFEKIDEKYSYFYFHIEVTASKELDNRHTNNTDNWLSVKYLRKNLAKNNILIIFNSYFNQEGMISLLSIIEKRMLGAIDLKKRMYAVMVEMVQNIIKHADTFDNVENGKVGLFYISEQEDYYTLHSGNYVLKQNIKKLENIVKKVNGLNGQELENEYDKQLLNYDLATSKEFGLGIIEMKIKSGNDIELNLLNVNTELSFCVLRAKLKKVLCR